MVAKDPEIAGFGHGFDRNLWRIVGIGQAIGSAWVEQFCQFVLVEPEGREIEVKVELRESAKGKEYQVVWINGLVHAVAAETPAETGELRKPLPPRAKPEPIDTTQDGEPPADAAFGMHKHTLGQDEDGDDITSLAAKFISEGAELEQARQVE